MREYYINFSTITDNDSLHNKINACLSLPDYYGRNLDALYDCLTDYRNCKIYLSGMKYLLRLGEYGNSVLKVFQDAAGSCSNLKLIIED